jgi:hypothetical protein
MACCVELLLLFIGLVTYDSCLFKQSFEIYTLDSVLLIREKGKGKREKGHWTGVFKDRDLRRGFRRRIVIIVFILVHLIIHLIPLSYIQTAPDILPCHLNSNQSTPQKPSQKRTPTLLTPTRARRLRHPHPTLQPLQNPASAGLFVPFPASYTSTPCSASQSCPAPRLRSAN